MSVKQKLKILVDFCWNVLDFGWFYETDPDPDPTGQNETDPIRNTWEKDGKWWKGKNTVLGKI